MSVETPWPICLHCKTIPLSLFRQSQPESPFEQLRKHRLRVSFASLRDSASRGCHACMLFYEAVHEPYKSELQTAPVLLESLFEEGSVAAKATAVTADLSRMFRSESSVESRLKAPSYECPFGRFEFAVIGQIRWTSDENNVSWSAKHYHGLVSSHQDDEGAIKYVKTSLEKCLNEHRYSCNMVAWPLGPKKEKNITVVHSKRGLSVAPTRLVDIGSIDGTELPRVVAGAQCLRHENPGYIALSYCNGFVPHNPPWHLTTSTQAAFEECIPLHLLPQTLRDAMEWTRILGDRFIWIDNLCILQDSAEDWNREALQMSSIYGSATVTLVAAAGSIYGGMTDRRNPLRNSACSLTPMTEATETITKIFLLPSGQKSTPQLSIPTEFRGWCFQEDILSPRLVRFSLKDVEWQCLGDKSNVRRAQGLERLAKHETYRWYLLWYALIERYSKKILTFPDDKLTAFSGIAANKMKDASTYIAGVCKEDVWAGLLWARDDAILLKSPGRRYSKFVAPSWSWAALDVPVIFHEAKNRSGRKVQLDSSPWDPILHSMSAEQTTFQNTGPVSEGFLELTAFAVTATTSLMRPSIFVTDRTEQLPGRQRLICSTNQILIGEITYDCAPEAKEGENLHCLLLHVADTHQWVKNGVCGLGIVLRASSEFSAELTYSRVGYVQFTDNFAKLAKRKRFRAK